MDLTDLMKEFAVHFDPDIQQIRNELKRFKEMELAAWDPRKFKELAEENLELKLRMGLLVRLLIAKGVFGAEEYASLLAAARSSEPYPASPRR